MTRHPLQKTLSHKLARVSKLFRARAHQWLDQIGLYAGQQFMLCALWNDEGITHSELAHRLHVQPATVTNALKRMERAGLVERRPDPDDQRVSRVYLTPAGWEIREAVEQVWHDLDVEVFAGFSAEERATLEGFVQRVYQNLQSMGEAPDHCPSHDCR
jgi:DNA-binding MarR family transcriptional regulator